LDNGDRDAIANWRKRIGMGRSAMMPADGQQTPRTPSKAEARAVCNRLVEGVATPEECRLAVRLLLRRASRSLAQSEEAAG